MEKLISEVYFDPATGLSIKNTFKNAHEKDPRITLKMVKDTVDKIANKQIFDKTVDKSKFIPIVASPGSYQADITFYNQYKTFNSGYEALVTIININTKKAYVYPIKNKSATTILEVMTKFLDEAGDVKVIETDEGTEFTNNKIKDLLKSKGILHKVYNKEKSKNAVSIVERFNRTIRSLIDQYLTSYKTKKYIDKLPSLLSNYNNSVNASTDQKPNEINFDGEKKLYEENKNRYDEVIKHIELEDPVFIDDKVRLLKNRGPFKKGMKTRYSKNVYKVTEVLGHNYTIKSENGKIKTVKPYMIKKIDEIIENPYIKKSEPAIKAEQTKFKNNKKQQKVKMELEKDGIQSKNILRNKLRSQKTRCVEKIK